MMNRSWRLLALALVLLGQAGSAWAADTLVWHGQAGRVDANLDGWRLVPMLRRLARVSGWDIFLEPGITNQISVKFKDLPVDEALGRLLHGINYMRVETNGSSQLFVYQTAAKSAIERVKAEARASGTNDHVIPNELLVHLKRNSKVNIDLLASQLGARIVGRDDKLRLYRLQFDDAAAAQTALDFLDKNDGVAQVDFNYTVDLPSPFNLQRASNPGGVNPLLNPPPPSKDGPVVGLVDTAVQPQDFLKAYLLKQMSEAGPATLPDGTPLHGTSMAETLLQGMGEAPGKILPVDVYGNSPNTSTYQVVLGIADAINAGANPINLSLGGTGDSQMLHDIIQQGRDKGILFVAAAGNDGQRNALSFPAAYPEVLSVTSIGPNGQLASYANSDSSVDAAASGTSYITLDGQTWVVEGTSVSTAYISGRIVQLINQNHLTMAQAINQVLATSQAPKK